MRIQCGGVDALRLGQHALLFRAGGRCGWLCHQQWTVLELCCATSLANKHAHTQSHDFIYAHTQRHAFQESLAQGQTCSGVTGDIPFWIDMNLGQRKWDIEDMFTPFFF